jgi:hypothetical protein
MCVCVVQFSQQTAIMCVCVCSTILTTNSDHVCVCVVQFSQQTAIICVCVCV